MNVDFIGKIIDFEQSMMANGSLFGNFCEPSGQYRYGYFLSMNKNF
ncbi:hypothetical protein SHD_0294 [Shewanella decolorationis S12]|uniref:Uncharacterized protein n=1 Tax=Shewanella decolorationis S12 TaxID=1353536 RepID=A0ABN0PSE0_9GAMM|nr:hypothetical protein SHD_0294 [Shewanella decolorationis S12]